ncbi:MAG: Ig-like domain repeat protein [Terracidiphilus sp.]|jgi:sugar lactone lactonase YvrE
MVLKMFKRNSAWLMSIAVLAGTVAGATAAAQSFTPPAVITSSTTTPYSGLTQTEAVAVDASGNIFYTQPAVGNFIEQPANGGAVITLATGLSYPKGVAVDNRGFAYATDYSGHLWKVPVGGGTPTDILPACNTLDAYYLGTQVVTVDGAGNVYTAGSNETPLFKITQAGVCSTIAGVTLNDSKTDGMSHVAADAAGDLYYSIGASLYVIPAGASSPVLVTSNFNYIIGLAADAVGDVFVTNSVPDSYTGVVDEVPFVNGAINGSDTFLALPFFSQYDVGVGADGTVYTTNGTSISLSTLGSVSFAPTAVGTQSGAATINLAFNSMETLSSLQFTSGAGATTEVANTGAGTCTIGSSYSAGSACTLTLAITPGGLGARNDRVQLLSGTSVIGSVAVAGQASGAGLTVDPGTQSNLGSGWTEPEGVAVDGSGNIFVADKSAGTVSFIPSGSTTATVIASSLSSPTGIAVASDGSVYVSESGAAKLAEIPRVNGAYGSAITVMTGLTTPAGVAIAGNGDIYLADSGSGKVYRMENDGGVVNFSTQEAYGSGFTAPAGLFVDAAGNLYVVDESAGKIVKFTGGVQSTIVSGLSSPVAVAVDPGGSLYIAQNGIATIERVPYVSASYDLNATSQLGAGLQSPAALTEDSEGNLYVADEAAAAVIDIDRIAGTLNFGSVDVGDSSAVETLTLSNIGNLSLSFATPLDSASGEAGDFAVTPECVAGGSLASGSTCSVSATFTPTQSTTRTDVLTFASNAVNTSTITGTLTGIGTSLPKTTTTLAQVTSGALTFGETVQFSATVAAAAGATGTPSGTVQFFVNGSSYGSAVPLNSGSASIAITGLPAGSNVIGATYSGNSSFAASSATALTVNVALASTTTALTATASSTTPVPPGTSITLSATVSSSVTTAQPSGNVTFSTGNTTLGTAPVSTTGLATLTSTSFPNGTYAIVASYSGDSGFAASTSNSVSIAIEPAQYLVSSTPTSLSVTAPGQATTSFVLTPISGYTGGVDMQCSGLPVNTSCTFTPGAAYFANTTNSSGATVAPGPETINLTLQTDTAPATTVAAWFLPVGGLTLMVFARKRRVFGRAMNLAFVAITIILLGGAGLLQGCSSSIPITPAGSSTVTVTLTGSPSGTSAVPTSGAGNIVKTFTFSLTVN